MKGISRVYVSMKASHARPATGASHPPALQTQRPTRAWPQARSLHRARASALATWEAAAQRTSTPSTTPISTLQPVQPPLTMCVYGSLLKGLSNHHLLERARYLGPCTTEAEYAMYDMSSMHIYPAVCARGRQAIVGELYEVDYADLEDIDRLEGHPRRYERQLITLASPAGQQAWMYILPRKKVEEGSRLVPEGDWRAHLRAHGVATRRAWAYALPGTGRAQRGS